MFPQQPQFVELRALDIDQGRMMEQVDSEMRRGVRELNDQNNARAKRSQPPITGKITLSLTVEIDVNDNGSADVSYKLKRSMPAVGSSTMARVTNGYIMSMPGGTKNENPDQLRMFDGAGVLVPHLLNTATGEITMPEPEAGASIPINRTGS